MMLRQALTVVLITLAAARLAASEGAGEGSSSIPAAELVDGLYDDDRQVRYECLSALESLGADAHVAIPEVVRAFLTPGYEPMASCGRTLAKLAGVDAMPIFLEAITQSPSKYVGVWYGLGFLGDDAIPPLVEALRLDTYGVACLLATRGAKGLPGAVQTLQGSDPIARRNALIAISHIEDVHEAKEEVPSLVSVLVANLDDEAMVIRLLAAKCLADLKAAEAAPAIRRAIESAESRPLRIKLERSMFELGVPPEAELALPFPDYALLRKQVAVEENGDEHVQWLFRPSPDLQAVPLLEGTVQHRDYSLPTPVLAPGTFFVTWVRPGHSAQASWGPEYGPTGRGALEHTVLMVKREAAWEVIYSMDMSRLEFSEFAEWSGFREVGWRGFPGEGNPRVRFAYSEIEESMRMGVSESWYRPEKYPRDPEEMDEHLFSVSMANEWPCRLTETGVEFGRGYRYLNLFGETRWSAVAEAVAADTGESEEAATARILSLNPEFSGQETVMGCLLVQDDIPPFRPGPALRHTGTSSP